MSDFLPNVRSKEPCWLLLLKELAAMTSEHLFLFYEFIIQNGKNCV